MKYVGMNHFAPFPGADKEHGWIGDRFRPLTDAEIARKRAAEARQQPEAKAATAVLSEAQQAEARRHFAPLIDPWRAKR